MIKEKKPKHICLHLFRYQLLPTSQLLQISFDPPISNIEELKEKKNAFFAKSLARIKEFDYARTKLAHRFYDLGNDSFAIQLGAKRNLKRSTRNFTEEEIENWPSIWIFINNNPDIQKMAIQLDGKVFFDTKTVARIIEQTLNKELHKYQLSLIIERLFEKRVFWEIVEKNTNKIIQANFELISPNLANISKHLTLDLSAINRSTNTQKTNFELNSDKDSSLTLSQNDPNINGLVNYSSEGGGEITLKIRGYRKKIKTSKAVKEIIIEEALISAKTINELQKVLKEIFHARSS